MYYGPPPFVCRFLMVRLRVRSREQLFILVIVI